MSTVSLELIAKRWLRLFMAVVRHKSEKTCLRRWSEFVRARDHFRCLICNSTEGIAAHHICRKSYMPAARFYPGNGITLCSECHKEAHEGFNGIPDPSLPMDEQGGEKIEKLAELYGVLAADSLEKGYYAQCFYYVGKDVFKRFKALQGFGPRDKFRGTRIQQIATIWRSPPQGLTRAVLQANFRNLKNEELMVARIALPGHLISQPTYDDPYKIVVDPK